MVDGSANQLKTITPEASRFAGSPKIRAHGGTWLTNKFGHFRESPLPCQASRCIAFPKEARDIARSRCREAPDRPVFRVGSAAPGWRVERSTSTGPRDHSGSLATIQVRPLGPCVPSPSDPGDRLFPGTWNSRRPWHSLLSARCTGLGLNSFAHWTSGGKPVPPGCTRWQLFGGFPGRLHGSRPAAGSARAGTVVGEDRRRAYQTRGHRAERNKTARAHAIPL